MKLKLCGKTINLDKVVHKGKTVNDFIRELEPNVSNIIRYAKMNGIQPFQGNEEKLKEWLISNQDGYEKYVPDIFYYFKDKCFPY